MKIKIYTDGSCLGNPGPGGWAYLIETEGEKIRGQGGEPGTTNNRMEMLAAIEGLKTIQKRFPEAESVDLYSDSSLLINTMSKNWKRKMNTDLWDELIPLVKGRKITWNWVRGHNGHPQNEDCDVRAQREAGKQPKGGRPISPGGFL
jgi:ribonuclease HI